jgi:hypothetical protein
VGGERVSVSVQQRPVHVSPGDIDNEAIVPGAKLHDRHAAIGTVHITVADPEAEGAGGTAHC